MPWQERSVESERAAFVRMAQEEGVVIAELCRHFGISRKTGYKWLTRAATGESLTDRSRRPHSAHVTVSNKVTPERARALLGELSAAFVPGEVTATGLALWRYLGGPWEPLGAYRFSPAATG